MEIRAAEPPASTIPETARRSSDTLAFTVLGLFLAALWFILCRQLSNEWSANEQYSYGWFVPFFAAYLFWSRWDEGQCGIRNAERGMAPQSSRKPWLALIAGAALLVLLPLRLFEVGNPDWRPLAWLHAAIVVAITLLVVRRIGGRAWLRHFAFPICFIFVAVPWVTPIESPIVQGLMRLVAAIASEMLNLLGLPAQLEGSVIRIHTGVVGVNEACSGVRSLQTSIMVGLLFGELKRLSVSRRVALVTGAVAIAFAANCLRAFLLVWIASERGVSAVGRWHDLAGYAILGAVFLGTVGIASALAKPDHQTASAQESATPHSEFRVPHSAFFVVPLLWLAFVEVAVEAWYRTHERNLVSTAAWTVNWPENTPGFRVLEIDENVRSTLRFDRGREAMWPVSIPTAPNESLPDIPATASMFFFRWEPGTTSILRARAHRPDICLPNTGWRMIADHGVRGYAVRPGITMPFRHFAFMHSAGNGRELSAHAFFCEREDRIPRAANDRFDLTQGTTSDWSRSDRLRVVLEGLRNQGQQVLELVLMSPSSIDQPTAETEFAKLAPKIIDVHSSASP